MVNADNENETLVLKFFETLSSGDLVRLRELFHEEATWTPMVRGIRGKGVHRGRAGIVDLFLAPVRGQFRPGDPKVLPDTIASKGPLVLIETRGIGHLTDGRPYDNRYAWAVEVREGKIFVVREYMDSLYVARLFETKSA